jgi:Heparan-alpha-glucosaminide N-acetyltransferase, catalytic
MKRISSLDLARGFTVLMIVPIHTVMLYSAGSVRNTLLSNLLAFIAEWHGAQIFMLIMGVSFTYSKNHSMEAVVKKVGILLIIAYGLNMIKFVVPHLFGWLPPVLIMELQIDTGIRGYTQLLGLGDILHFAAIALLVLFAVSKTPSPTSTAITLVTIISFFSPFLWDSHSDNPFINYILNLITGQPPQVFFPLLPWLVYPLLGLYVSHIIQKKEQWVGFDSFWIIGVVLIGLASTMKYWLHYTAFDSFYRTGTWDTMIHVGFVLIALSGWHWISLNVKPNYVFRLFTYCSRRITQIYIIQWILIFWLLPFIDYQQTGFTGTILLIILTSAITLTGSLFIDLMKSWKTN